MKDVHLKSSRKTDGSSTENKAMLSLWAEYHRIVWGAEVLGLRVLILSLAGLDPVLETGER